MADITDQHDQTSPTELDEPHSVGNGNAAVGESRGIKRARPSTADDDDDDDEKGGRERRKIEIKFISDKSRRHITFSKRKAGIMKKVRFLHRPQLPRLPNSATTPGFASARQSFDGGTRC
jgi:MADS-box transcription factor